MTLIVLLSYGRESEYRRAIMTILSFWGWNSEKQVRVALFTDNPDYFEPFLAGLPVEYLLTTPEKIKEMKGPMNFIHRVKIAVIDEAFKKLRPEKLLYVDSDTYFQADPAPMLSQISSMVSAMHMPEHTLEQFAPNSVNGPEIAQLSKLITDRKFSTSWGPQQFHTNLFSWNAGVLGLGAASAALLPDVYMLTDEFYKCSNWAISEQIAFSFVLQTRTQLIEASPYIIHYFTPNGKRAMDTILSSKITDAFGQLLLSERLAQARQLTIDMPATLKRYFAQNAELELQDQAMDAFHNRQMAQGYKYSVLAFIKAPRDVQFLKHVLYHTKRRFLSRIS